MSFACTETAPRRRPAGLRALFRVPRRGRPPSRRRLVKPILGATSGSRRRAHCLRGEPRLAAGAGLRDSRRSASRRKPDRPRRAGACRQVLAEFSPLMTVVYRSGGEVVATTAASVYPTASSRERRGAPLRDRRPGGAPERRQVDARERPGRRARRGGLGDAPDHATACARRGQPAGLSADPRRSAGVPEAVRPAHRADAARGGRRRSPTPTRRCSCSTAACSSAPAIASSPSACCGPARRHA